MEFIDFLQLAISGIAIGSVYAIVALSFTIVFNATGVVNFAQGEYAMVAALIAVTLIDLHTPYLVAMLVAILGATLVGCLVYYATVAPIPRVSHFTSILVTLGTAIVLQKCAQLIGGTESRALPGISSQESVDLFGATITPQAFGILLLASVLMAVLYFFFKYTRRGQALIACSENHEVASLVGIRTDRVHLSAYLLGCTLGGVAGVLVAPITTMSTAAGLGLTIKGFTASVLGGFGSPIGAVVGGILLGLFEALGAGLISSGYQDLIALLGLLLVLMFRSGGIVGSRVFG